MKNPAVYILASGRNGTLYIGVTSDLIKRIHEHKTKTVPGFTASHRIHYLVWLEQHATRGTAISREKALKEWKRAWKIRLIEESNPYWRDLFDDIVHDAV
jgi:putative endonuclease